MCFVQRLLDSARQRDVILLQKNRIIESEAVIGASARLHCIFLECPQAGCRFSSITNTSLRSRQLFHEAAGQCGDQIGRAACRGRGEISVGAVSLKKKKKKKRKGGIFKKEKCMTSSTPRSTSVISEEH